LDRQQPEKAKQNVDFAPPLEKFLRTTMLLLQLVASEPLLPCHCYAIKANFKTILAKFRNLLLQAM